MPYIITTRQNSKVVYLQDKVKVLNGRTRREWSVNRNDALVLFVNDAQLKDYIRNNLWDIREKIEVVHVRTSPKPKIFSPVST